MISPILAYKVEQLKYYCTACSSTFSLCIVGVDRSPTDAETRSICKKISSRWEGFAIEVDPPLEIQDIENIQRANQHDPCYQATVMLERWMQKYTSKATARHLIEALVRFGRRDVAEEVFTPLTVEQVVVEPQDPK